MSEPEGLADRELERDPPDFDLDPLLERDPDLDLERLLEREPDLREPDFDLERLLDLEPDFDLDRDARLVGEREPDLEDALEPLADRDLKKHMKY